MRGLALEGGGARGAYHIGVVKALLEAGYEFDGFVGTSIGAINAAMLAQGDFERALELWRKLSMEQIFDDAGQQLLSLAELKDFRLSSEKRSGLKLALAKIISEGGVNTEKMKTLLERYIDEGKIRKSGKDYGLVTVSLSDRKPLALMLEDIPSGQLLGYIMASASFPGFQPEVIGENVFLDGGFYDNCPYQLLSDKGYAEIIAVRTNAPGIFRKADDPAKVKSVVPRQDLGSLMLFSPERSAANIELGYYDGLRFAQNLHGRAYYIRPIRADQVHARLMSLDDQLILEAGKVLGFSDLPARRMLFEKIIPQLSAAMKLGKDYDYTDFAVALLEYAAAKKGVNHLQVYDYSHLCALVRDLPEAETEREKSAALPMASIAGKNKTAAELLSGGII